MVDILPNKDRINFFVPLLDMTCFLCDDAVEPIHHMLFNCPVTKLCWWALPWQLRIQNFVNMNTLDWFSTLLGLNFASPSPLDSITNDKLLHFAVVVMESMWME